MAANAVESNVWTAMPSRTPVVIAAASARRRSLHARSQSRMIQVSANNGVVMLRA